MCILRARGFGHTGEGVGECVYRETEDMDTLGRGWGSVYIESQRFWTHWGGGGGVCILRARGFGHTGEGVGECVYRETEDMDTLGRG